MHKLNILIFHEHNDMIPECSTCNMFEENDWYSEPKIDIKYYSCKCGGCKKLAEYYRKKEYTNSFHNKVIKKFL